MLDPQKESLDKEVSEFRQICSEEDSEFCSIHPMNLIFMQKVVCELKFEHETSQVEWLVSMFSLNLAFATFMSKKDFRENQIRAQLLEASC